MTLVVCALIVADVLWAIATLAYVELRLLDIRRYLDATRQRIMERIAEE